MDDDFIDSRQNPRVKNLVKLRERKHRDRQERFLIEGLRELGHAFGAGVEVEELFFCPEHFPAQAHTDFVDRLRDEARCPLTRLSPAAFEKAAYREGPDGLLAAARQFPLDPARLPLGECPLLLVLEGIEKPGNLGAILRSADAAGVDAVLLADTVVDPFNPNAIRASQGLVFAVPLATGTSTGLINWLHERGIRVVATTPDTGSTHWDLDYNAGTALALGSESEGLTAAWLEAADARIRIPMAGRADSLNVAAATAVCLYEARRQRESISPAAARRR